MVEQQQIEQLIVHELSQNFALEFEKEQDFLEEMETEEEYAEEESAEPEDPNKLRCQLVGSDGNVFAIIGNVKRTLERAGLRDKAKEFTKRALEAGSYDEVLQMCFEYVDVC